MIEKVRGPVRREVLVSVCRKKKLKFKFKLSLSLL